mmetsp:Transcript_1348/g.2907  ORF Transcript_1348/g.2907 Transcript_1348/m.2907 type:complete len:232 (-) Transcript_1348:847-1542(-)
MKEAVGARKLRFLCLHGYAQNGQMFRSRTGALRKALKGVEFDFVDAPHTASASFIGESSDDERGAPLGWWNSAECDTRPSLSARYIGLAESLEHVQCKLRDDGPYDGVLGFSQGATLAVLLCLLTPPPTPFRMAVLVAGFMPRDEAVLERMAESASGGELSLPSMHVTGSSDSFVPTESTERLAKYFREMEFFAHAGGHGIPSGVEFRNAAKKFVALHALDSSGAGCGAAE